MKSWVSRIDEAFYRGVEGNWDDALFRKRILAVLTPESKVLDLGAGAGIVEQMNFRGHAARVCGVDLDPRIEENPWLDEGKVADVANLPFGDETFDVVFADNVMEHLPEPLAVLSEVKRVLRPGGMFLFKTPNKWHYMPLIARYTPHRFHQFINRRRGRAEIDTFPTRYLANSRSTILSLARASGLEAIMIERLESRPEYLRIAWPTYLLGFAYERLVNSADFFAMFRIVLIGQLRKPVK